MNFPFYIARRYLFAKKSHNVINIISLVSVCGIVVATAAMICTLSVLNGFKGLTTTLFSMFDPELKITPTNGKVFDPTTQDMQRLREMPEVAICSEILQENALVRYNDRQEISVLKGVDESFRYLANIDTAVVDGRYVLQEGDVSYTVMGIGLAAAIGVNAAFAMPVEIYIPKREENINLANPATSFKTEYAYIGGVYHISQPTYDEGFMLLPIQLLRSMLNYEKEVSALELKLATGAKISSVKKEISQILGNEFMVQDRYEQQEAAYKMVQIEKWVSFLILCFILVLALFNVVGSLSILMIEKEKDIVKLRSLGADNRLINNIFLFEGWMISLFGAILGVILGLSLCFLQKRFGLISLGQTAGTFIVDAYPVEVVWTDVLIIIATVVSIGFFAAWYPIHFLGRKWLNQGMAALLTPLLLTACTGQGMKHTPSDEIAVTIEPQRHFAERIAGGHFKIFSVVPVGQGPETYDPTPREMVRIGNSKAYFCIGQLGFEQALMESIQANNPQVQFFNLSKGMAMIADNHHHKEDSNNDHHHRGQDPHIWTSFSGAKVISKNILQALSVLDAAHQAEYKSRFDSLQHEIDTLDHWVHLRLDTLTCRSFVIYHPALSYFAQEFGLTQLSIEHDGKEPSPATIKQLIRQARDENVRVVFVQKEFDTKYAEQIAQEIDARIVPINPLDYEWVQEIKKITEALTGYGKIN